MQSATFSTIYDIPLKGTRAKEYIDHLNAEDFFDKNFLEKTATGGKSISEILFRDTLDLIIERVASKFAETGVISANDVFGSIELRIPTDGLDIVANRLWQKPYAEASDDLKEKFLRARITEFQNMLNTKFVDLLLDQTGKKHQHNCELLLETIRRKEFLTFICFMGSGSKESINSNSGITYSVTAKHEQISQAFSEHGVCAAHAKSAMTSLDSQFTHSLAILMLANTIASEMALDDEFYEAIRETSQNLLRSLKHRITPEIVQKYNLDEAEDDYELKPDLDTTPDLGAAPKKRKLAMEEILEMYNALTSLEVDTTYDMPKFARDIEVTFLKNLRSADSRADAANFLKKKSQVIKDVAIEEGLEIPDSMKGRGR